ncbi:MFS transporter [Sporosarcina highlanderae]|uniref:MFS transporter n=1 Tax=Sporosarcina highlanderae TaxID=3035916 RepID=A0ABT8JM13_9BACL|nr:MFS transporter [Sporosarcina highlanderae]MDN4606186.1 MFS transporter [Sporosarcina highlanderae]
MIKRNMSLIVTNQFLTNLADSIFTISIMWYMYDITQSPLSSALVTAVGALTAVFIAPLIGVIVDRKEPKGSMQIGYAVMTAIGVLLTVAYLFWLDWVAFAIYAALILHNICMTFIGPAKNKLLPRIVGVERIVKVNGYISSTSKTSYLIGQGISGVLITIMGFVGVMLLHSGVYIIASILLIFVINVSLARDEEESEAASTKKPSMFSEFKEGWAVLRNNRPILKLSILASLMNATTIAGALMVVLVTDQYGGNAFQFGLFGAFAAIGGILIGLVADKVTSFAKPYIVLFISLAGAGAAFMFMGVTSGLYVGIVLYVAMNTLMTVYGVLYSSLLIVLVEDKYRGRVYTLNGAIATFLMPGFAIAGGIIAEWGIPVNQLWVGAGIWVLLLSLFFLLDPDIREIHKVSGKKAKTGDVATAGD